MVLGEVCFMSHQQKATLLSQTFDCFRIEFSDMVHASVYAKPWEVAKQIPELDLPFRGSRPMWPETFTLWAIS